MSRVTAVTGAAHGIGRAIAWRLAADRYAVAVVDRDVAAAENGARTIAAAGGAAVSVAGPGARDARSSHPYLRPGIRIARRTGVAPPHLVRTLCTRFQGSP